MSGNKNMQSARRKETLRVGVREGYDLWARTYDQTPNPVVALDARHTFDLLSVRAGERVLDAGCGTGRNLSRLRQVGARPVGIDFSLGMLRVASERVPGVALVQADLEADFPLREARFSSVLCALIGEHLRNLAFTFRMLYQSLAPGGRLVFSVYHPDLAEAGKEANFELGGTEYRLGAVRYRVEDYLEVASRAGFRDTESFEFSADEELIHQVPAAVSLRDKRVILALRATRPA